MTRADDDDVSQKGSFPSLRGGSPSEPQAGEVSATWPERSPAHGHGLFANSAKIYPESAAGIGQRIDPALKLLAVDFEAENAKLRARLAALELRLDQTFTRSTAVKLVIDPTDGRIVEANPAAISFYGYSAEEFAHLRITDLNQLPPELVAEEMAAAREQRRTYFEFKHRLKSGAVRDVQVYSGPVRVEGRDYLHSIICDITDRTQLADQLAHSQRMEALGRLAGGVAHDINNLLTALDMLASLIRSDVEHARPVEPHLREVEQLTQRGASLTGQLLAFCRRQMLESRLLDLGSVLRGIEALLRRVLSNSV
ncbi:MAG: PAS domain S-box protein, partial [Polyangiaceae bacterium]